METKNNLIDFYDACTDMQNAKIILADAKIGKILRIILESADLFATVGECLINFNYEIEKQKAQIKNDGKPLYLKLPQEQKKLVALVFNLLSEFDTHTLDLHSFIREYFTSGDSFDMSYGFLNFVHKVIFPFRDALCAILSGDDEINLISTEQKVEKEEVQKTVDEDSDDENECVEEDLLGNFYSQVNRVLKQIKDTINADPKVKPDRRDEINITIDGMVQSMDIGNLKIMNALVISLYYLLAGIKSVRFYRDELQEVLSDFYAKLQN
ncbi:MAG: hypothetical protein IJ837_04115 [Clostridia bacterium]|nr:hypothetical protein [Clostridia bacterium]